MTRLLFLLPLVACAPLSRGVPVEVDYDVDAPLGHPSLVDPPEYLAQASFDPEIVPPAACLGFEPGSRMASSAEIIECFRGWAEASPHATFTTHGSTHEGRDLVRVVISSPENLDRLDAILGDLGQLTNPRGLSADAAQRVIQDTPAVGWFGYSIHGDETSGADASVLFGHYLIAGTDDRARHLREQTVIVIDPVMNPDGRERLLGLVNQSRSQVASLNPRSLHRGTWPRGRGNHYLFDLNRDWFVGSQPETRARWDGFRTFHPQLFVDVHEMGPLETYLFSPKGEPVNPQLGPSHSRWNPRFASDQAAAFDAFGWSYYTREWSDNWYPGYSSTWGPLQGAVGILHEQARYAGQDTRRTTGEIASYADAVHHQLVGSLANATTLADNREELLRDYLAFHQAGLDGPARTFAIRPGAAEDRVEDLVFALIGQGIEVHRADTAFTGLNAESVLRDRAPSLRYPAGTTLIDAAQPKGALALALLGLDPRMDKASLEEERRDLVRSGRGSLYDVTAWNLGMAFDLDAAWIDVPRVARTALLAPPERQGGLDEGDTPAVAWGVRGDLDRSLAFATSAMEAGLKVFASDKPFDAAGQRFPRGSLLLRATENPPDLRDTLEAIAAQTGVRAVALSTNLSSTEGPDLGGTHFELLARPRVALVSNHPASPSDVGHLWHQLDQRLGIPLTQLDAQVLAGYDLRPYNVIIVPHVWGSLQLPTEALKHWIRAGGTLIAVGSGVHAVNASGLTDVSLRRQVLEALTLYEAPASRWLEGQKVDVDPERLWSEQPLPPPSPAESFLGQQAEPRSGEAASTARAAEDAWLRRFSPSGTEVRGLIDDDHWLSIGLRDQMPVLAQGSLALMAPESVRVPVRLAPADRLRLSGLLWPEGRARIEKTAWATVERSGAGQVILFAGRPGFRDQQRGTARLFANAVVLGPGLGTRQALEW